MTYKKKSQIALVSFIISLFILTEYVFWTTDNKAKDVIVADGMISAKFENDYACGTKGRYICYSRYLVIDGKRINVNLNTFTSNNIGEHITLSMSEKPELTKYQATFMVLHFIICIAFSLALISLTIMFIYWSVNKSDKISFREWLSS